MKKINEYKKLLKDERPSEWELIPDIELYKDQVLNFMQRQHLGLKFNETLTSPMINNYIKQGVMPKASGKKYNKEHIAYITAICLLKQVVSVTETKTLINLELENSNIENFYDKFIEEVNGEYDKMNEVLTDNKTEKELADLALKLAIQSYASKLACEFILESFNEEKTPKSETK